MGLLAVLCLALGAAPAAANNHLVKIKDFFPGSVAHPTAQFIELQLYSPGENFFNGTSVVVSNNLGTPVATYNLANATNGADQSTLLLATAQAQTDYSVTADATMATASIPLSGGKICYFPTTPNFTDCVSWGNYAGGVGTGESSSGSPFAPGGLTLGSVVARHTSRGARPCALDGTGDDTNDSTFDLFFQFGVVRPRANAAPVPGGACVRSADGTLRWTADPGVENDVALTAGSGSVTLLDGVGDLYPGDGCEPTDVNEVRCGTAEIGAIKLKAGDANDVVESIDDLPVPLTIDGGTGNDQVHAAGTEADKLKGGDGKDVLNAIDGSPGAADTLLCGAGSDQFSKDSSDAKKDCETKVV